MVDASRSKRLKKGFVSVLALQLQSRGLHVAFPGSMEWLDGGCLDGDDAGALGIVAA